jgi:hypothetical protein
MIFKREQLLEAATPDNPGIATYDEPIKLPAPKRITKYTNPQG